MCANVITVKLYDNLYSVPYIVQSTLVHISILKNKYNKTQKTKTHTQAK